MLCESKRESVLILVLVEHTLGDCQTAEAGWQ